MVICPQCFHRNPTSAVRCEQCDSPLAPVWDSSLAERGANTTALSGERAAILTSPVPAEGRRVDAHRAPTAAGAQVEQVDQAPPAGIASAQIPLARIRLRMDDGTVFDLAGRTTYLIGRRDAQSGLTPDVDLTDMNGAASGVSRRHAAIYVVGNTAYIEDLGSRNETVRNEYRLAPHQRYQLADGDRIRLGTIALAVTVS